MTKNRLTEIRERLALVKDIPLFEIPDDAKFTLDQHLAFGRLTDEDVPYLAALDAEREDRSRPARHELEFCCDREGVWVGVCSCGLEFQNASSDGIVRQLHALHARGDDEREAALEARLRECEASFADVERAATEKVEALAAAEAERDALLEAVAEFERLAVRHEKAASRAAFLNDQYENEGVARGLRKALEVIEKRGKR